MPVIARFEKIEEDKTGFPEKQVYLTVQSVPFVEGIEQQFGIIAKVTVASIFSAPCKAKFGALNIELNQFDGLGPGPVWGRPWMQGYLEALETRTALRLLSCSMILVCLSFLPLCAFLYLQGRKIIVSGCYPAPGVKVMRDTEVIRGRRAFSRGRLLVRVPLVIAVVAILSAGYFPYWLNNLAASQTRLQHPSGHGLLV